MDIDQLTAAEVRAIRQLWPTLTTSPSTLGTAFRIGQAYLIRTPTVYHLGRVVAITPTELVLNEAGWLADTGRFGECISKGTYNEFEPMGDGVIVPRCNISDATPWRHSLPKEPK